jgi:molybdate/tungstate transport system ATP-binding protein
MIRVERLAVRAGAFALSGLDFEVGNGQYAVLMGRTGSGKTTLLEAICGLKPVVTGRISFMGVDVTRLKPAARGIGYVPQDRALFQTMTVREHLAFALTIRDWARAEIDDRVAKLAGLLGLERLLDRKPAGLSGGEAQRVALGRALAARPGILCLDEPLSALDDDTREEMCLLLESVQKYTGVTTLHVTHHLGDAERLADVILVLKDGKIERAPTRVEGGRPRIPDPACP